MFLMFEMYMLNLDCTLEEHIFGAVAKPFFFLGGPSYIYIYIYICKEDSKS